MQNSMVEFTVSVFDRIYPFWVNQFQKIKIVTLSWNLVHKLIHLHRIQWWYSLSCFRPETPFFLGKFGSKNHNYQFKMKFGTEISLNIQNSMVVFTFSVLDWKYPSWANLVQKIKIISLTWNLVSWLIRICRIQW